MATNNIVRSYDGFSWVDGGEDTDNHLSFGGHETALGPYLVSLCNPELAYINVGAHVGTWAVRLADHNKITYAIEANPQTFDVLIDNVRLNGLEEKIQPICTVAWDRDFDHIQLVDVNDKATGGSTRAQPVEKGLLTFTLDTLFLGSHADVYEAPRIGLISMDVEGAEAKVLAGARRILAEERPNMLIELHEGHPGTDPDLRQQVYAILDEFNYTYVSLWVTGNAEHLFVRPTEALETMEPE